MALNGPSVGDAYIDVHANTLPFDRDLKRDLEKSSTDADEILNKIGERWGEKLSASVSNEISKHGKDFGRSMEKATEKITVKVRSQYDIDNNVLRNSRGRFVKKIEGEVDQAIRAVASPGGPFSRLGTAIADAIGAGFNISGKSPLITFLIPVIGVIVALVAAALQAINALVAVIATLPALLVAVGAQAAIVLVAFQGMGTAIQGALAAKNAKELNQAIKDLTPSAQAFVKSIVAAKDAFKAIQRSIQERFFAGLGDIVGPIVKLFDPVTMSRVDSLAQSLGEFFRGIALFFASPDFKAFLNDVLPATAQFLNRFGPAFVTFLNGLIKIADAALPFLTALGDIGGSIFKRWGEDLARVAGDPSLQKWFADMEETLQSVRELFGAVVDFLAVFLAELNSAGGVKIIQELTDAFDQLTFLLASPVGEKFMQGIITLSIAAIMAFTGMVEILILLIAGLEWLADTGIPDAIKGLGILFEKVGNYILDFFTMIGQPILDFFTMIGQWILDAAHAIGRWFEDLWHRFTSTFTNARIAIKDFITGLPDRIVAWLSGMKDTLINAGRNLIEGFKRGITDRLPSLHDLLSSITNLLPDWKGPEEKDRKLLVPAGKATMEGFQEGIRLGSMDLRAMLTEFTSSLGGLSVGGAGGGITFGRDAIRITFEGALPTREQAMATGSAVGAGINSQLTTRNTRLAIRTL